MTTLAGLHEHGRTLARGEPARTRGAGQPCRGRGGVRMNLTTRYMGLTLKNPMVASASPLSQRVDTIRRLEDHGAGAIVMFSLFEEQIRHDQSVDGALLGAGR